MRERNKDFPRCYRLTGRLASVIHTCNNQVASSFLPVLLSLLSCLHLNSGFQPHSLPNMASLDEELTCSVCRDTFTQVHPLPCGHSFCPACIREAWNEHSDGKSRFTCPQCQEESGGVPCDCCAPAAEDAQPPQAVKTCLRCEVSLCAEHLQPHLERPAYSSHLLVDPLGDLSQRRCPAHSEILRYYCADERLYVCGDCLLEGGHAQHKVKALKQVEDDLKVRRENAHTHTSFKVSLYDCFAFLMYGGFSLQVILQTLLIKAEEKLKNGENIIREHENIDATMAVSKTVKDKHLKKKTSVTSYHNYLYVNFRFKRTH